MDCKICNSTAIKKGLRNNNQRYYCKKCKLHFQKTYLYNAYNTSDTQITELLKEGVGIRSTSRLLRISTTTVLNRIVKIASKIKPPIISFGKEYEVDELCTYIGNKNRKFWVAYSLRKDSKEVVNLVIGRRTTKTLNTIINTLLLSNPKKIFTDKLNIYKALLPKELHSTKQYSTNHIERKNLSLRTHLKRLNRRTTCFSKSVIVLSACLKIYFGGGNNGKSLLGMSFLKLLT